MKLSDTDFKSQIPVYFRHFFGLFPMITNPSLGKSSFRKKSIISLFDSWNIEQRQHFIFQNMKQNVDHAYFNIPFYRDHYDKNGFKPSDLESFCDIKTIPVINKSLLLEYPIEKRCYQVKGALKVNTGGSSGHVLAFYTDSIGTQSNERIHMETIWKKLGYRNSDLKLVLNGQSKVKDGIDFCFRSNSIRQDIYKDFDKLSPKLKHIARNTKIRFLHGYPSILYEFALYCDEHDHELREILKNSLKGAFLGSEYPHKWFRDKIESVFKIETVNWYGHTEGAVLAYEKKEKFRYYPFNTYGFAEVTDEGHLMASSYYNHVSPFIRYDTEDNITDVNEEDGFLISFSIKDGRSGEYIIDKNGKRISLTALIFGRHHRLFDYCSHIQICQMIKGQAIVIYVPKEKKTDFNPEALFDSGNIEMEFSFRRISDPIKTKTGKLNLLIAPNQLENNV
jgi:phenylacetate-CoA ligase